MELLAFVLIIVSLVSLGYFIWFCIALVRLMESARRMFNRYPVAPSGPTNELPGQPGPRYGR